MMLSTEDSSAFRTLALDRSTTTDAAWSWLRQHGYKTSRATAYRWMRKTRAAADDPAAALRANLIARVEAMNADEINHAYTIVFGSPPTELVNYPD